MTVLVLDERQIDDVLENRRHRGVDRWDEMWDGVLHMVPPPGADHQTLTSFLNRVYYEVVVEDKLGKVLPGAKLARTGPEEKNYRVPDLAVVLKGGRGRVVKQGVAGSADQVVEVYSDGDESYEKFDYYASLGVQEILIIDREARWIELYRLHGKKYFLVAKSPQRVVSGVIPISMQIVKRGRTTQLKLTHTETGKSWTYP
jgi:Uma2 family endonuclease